MESVRGKRFTLLEHTPLYDDNHLQLRQPISNCAQDLLLPYNYAKNLLLPYNQKNLLVQGSIENVSHL